MSAPAPPAWYEDLDIYQVNVRSFLDSNADGIGDLPGLEAKLPYVRDLGVGAIWLLPIFPSPLRDGGYDVSDFRAIHPDLGTMDDFRRLLDRAHAEGLRVILDLVLNHTSDRHPWFQSARLGPGHPHHDWYVWRPDPGGYAQARVIFRDTEASNWTRDPACGLWYWHRFFSHQPDLNYDNPRVREERIETARFWLGLGVDGFRLDAVPYLFEREGTSCESLPETHAFLKDLRRATNAFDPPRVLIAEANQPPAEMRRYFGDGDECHMVFHFPLMPRLFLAVRGETARPLLDVVHDPPLPAGCQWAMFLRNHDELSLEMVSAEEREFLLAAFAEDADMRVNLGIRRRLWPLMLGGQGPIELLHALILGLPGCAVFYYGDEVGMGDDLALADRQPVRTPMQWTAGRNAGFSEADPSRLEVPVVTTPAYHYAGRNVDSWERVPASFLRWFRRFVRAHRDIGAFRGHGMDPVEVDNARVFACVRRSDAEAVLCVYNLSRYVQAASLQLPGWEGARPREVIGGSAFPAVGEGPYALSLGPHGFYWLRLEPAGEPASSPVGPLRTVLFVCRYNSARSQLAEALARSLADPRTRVLSAGLVRTEVNREVLQALEEIGLDARRQSSKTLEAVAVERVDEVIVLAEEARGPVARLFPGSRHLYWPTEDPVAVSDPAEVPDAVRRVRDLLADRIRGWLREEIPCR